MKQIKNISIDETYKYTRPISKWRSYNNDGTLAFEGSGITDEYIKERYKILINYEDNTTVTHYWPEDLIINEIKKMWKERGITVIEFNLNQKSNEYIVYYKNTISDECLNEIKLNKKLLILLIKHFGLETNDKDLLEYFIDENFNIKENKEL